MHIIGTVRQGSRETKTGRQGLGGCKDLGGTQRKTRGNCSRLGYEEGCRGANRKQNWNLGSEKGSDVKRTRSEITENG